MRILIAHEAPAGGGGVETYLEALMPALAVRGHQLAFLHHNSRAQQGPTRLDDPEFESASVADDGLDAAIAHMREWRPDVCFSHNMGPLEVEERLASTWPTVKMMHGYFGTCIGGQKAHTFPGVVPCSRQFGAPCLALYLPRRCGQLRPLQMFTEYAWAKRQRALLKTYSHVVVASAHMSREYSRHGVSADRLTVAPLFPTAGDVASMRPVPERTSILFMGRMTKIKGGAALVAAVAEAARLTGTRMRLVFAGDGPEQPHLRALARDLPIEVSFPGWLTGAARVAAFRAATLVAVPSLWPEPFGLVGLEAAAHGVPAVAFDAGGIGEWLRDNEGGRLVRERDPRGLGRAIAEICSDRYELIRLGEGAQRAARMFTRDSHIAVLERVFARAATGGEALA